MVIRNNHRYTVAHGFHNIVGTDTRRLSVFKFQNFLDGDLDEMIDNLITADTTEKLKNS